MTQPIERAATGAIDPRTWAEIVDCCTEAYEEPFASVFAAIGPAEHVWVRDGSRVVSHLCWVERTLQAGEGRMLRTAYVEAVATRPSHERRGLATALLQACAQAVQDFDLAALGPSEAAFYGRLGWEPWHGPLFARTPDGLEACPDEEIMILRTAQTPALDKSAPLSCEWRPGEVW